MKHRIILYYLIPALCALCTSCSTSEESEEERMRRLNQKGEYIYRHDNEYSFKIDPPTKKTPSLYPWEVGNSGKHPKITKEFFRCKGSYLNPVNVSQSKGKEEAVRYNDCGGSQKHSLSLKDGREYVYPILIDLLNHLQIKTGKKVVITSGYRCPDHNTYVDASPENRFSKHMIGAEVAFYVQGMENAPEKIVKYVMDYYQETAKYQNLKDYQEFSRYEKSNTDVKTQPWYNKEVFVKIYGKKEGRNFDNRHPYPYVSIQVRTDWDLKEKVTYSWEKAFNNYLRW